MATANPIALKAARYARLALGTPYVYGGTEYDKGVDCSGLCFVAYRMAGHPIPRTSEEQFKIGESVKKGTELPGDLIFSYNNEGGVPGPGHVVMSLGNGMVIAADHTGTVVHIEPASTFDSVYVGSRRVLPASDANSSQGNSGGGGVVSDLSSGFDTLTNPHTWYRAGQVILGGALAVYGVWTLATRSNPIG